MMDFKTTRQFKNKNMNLKRIFGALLTLLGIVGLVYTAVTFVNTKGNNQDVKILFMYGILGTIFFVSGISLIKTTKYES